MNKEIDFLKLRAAIELDQTFDILKEKYKDIEVDMVSWRENPSCVCGRRVHEFFKEIYNKEEESVFLDSILDKDIVQEKANQIINKVSTIKRKADQVPENMTDYRGKVFVVGKREEDWQDFWKKIIEDRAAYRTFSLLEKDEYIKVYFL